MPISPTSPTSISPYHDGITPSSSSQYAPQHVVHMNADASSSHYHHHQPDEEVDSTPHHIHSPCPSLDFDFDDDVIGDFVDHRTDRGKAGVTRVDYERDGGDLQERCKGEGKSEGTRTL